MQLQLISLKQKVTSKSEKEEEEEEKKKTVGTRNKNNVVDYLF